MKRQEFVGKHLDHLINSDEDIQRYFANAGTEKEKELLKKGLEGSLDAAYEKYASGYFNSKGIGSYVSTFLRWTGAAADAIGTYLFWSFGGAGIGIKAIGFGEKTIADLIDNYHYEKHKVNDGTVTKDGLSILAETAVERAAALWPLGVGEVADLYRGTRKYDSKILGQALTHAKLDFIKKYGTYEPQESPKIVSLDSFRNKRYLDEELREAA